MHHLCQQSLLLASSMQLPAPCPFSLSSWPMLPAWLLECRRTWSVKTHSTVSIHSFAVSLHLAPELISLSLKPSSALIVPSQLCLMTSFEMPSGLLLLPLQSSSGHAVPLPSSFGWRVAVASIFAWEHDLSILFEHHLITQCGDKSQIQKFRKHGFKSYHSDKLIVNLWESLPLSEPHCLYL